MRYLIISFKYFFFFLYFLPSMVFAQQVMEVNYIDNYPFAYIQSDNKLTGIELKVDGGFTAW